MSDATHAGDGELAPSAGHAGQRLAGGAALLLTGFGLLLFGGWTAQQAIMGYRARPPAVHDVPNHVTVFLLFFFGAVQVGAGLGVAIAGARLVQEARRRAAHAAEPWLWRADWAAGRITHSLGPAAIAAWAAAVGWNAALWGAMMPVVPVRAWIEQDVYGGLACVGAAILLGVGILGWAVRDIYRWWRSRQSVFEMTSVPGSIGGELTGSVRARVTPSSEEAFRVRLVCEQNPGLGGTRDALWQPEYMVGGQEVALSALYAAVPVRFEIPQACRPSSFRLRNAIEWRLEVVSTSGGGHYRASFRVPVFAPELATPRADP